MSRASAELTQRAPGADPRPGHHVRLRGCGYAVPEGFSAKVTETRKFYAMVAELAEVVTTDLACRCRGPRTTTPATPAASPPRTPRSPRPPCPGQATLDAYNLVGSGSW